MRRRVHQDWSDKTTTFEVVQDVEPYLEHNKQLRSMEQKSDWGRHVASIPNVIINRWLQEAWNSGNKGLKFGTPEFNEIVRKKLDDPDWAYLRVDAAPLAYRT